MSDALAANPLVHAIGLALLHFVWQGALIGGAAATVLHATRRRAASTRYLIGCGALLLMAVAPVFTTADALRAAPPSGRLTAAPSIVAPTSAVVPPTSPVLAATTTRNVLPAPPPRIARALPVVVCIWGAGVFLMALHLAGSWCGAARLRASARPLDETWQARVLALSRRLGIRRTVRLVGSTLVDVPTLVGWVKPMILAPASVLAGLSPAEFEAVLAHELAHVRRHDYLVNALQAVIETLLFFHPAVWWVSHRVRVEREYCCDDAAVAWSADRVGYARALAALEQQCHAPALALAATDGDLVARIRRVLGAPADVRRGASAWGAMLMVASLTIALGAGRVAAGNAAIADPASIVPRDIELAPRAFVRSAATTQALPTTPTAIAGHVNQPGWQVEPLGRDQPFLQPQSAPATGTDHAGPAAYELGRAIGAREAAFEVALTAHDEKALGALLSDGFQLITVFGGGATTEVGQVRTKAEVLKGVTGLHAIQTDFTSNGISGGAVVVTGSQDTDPNGNRYLRSTRVVYTHVWVKEADNEWRMISCVDFTGVDPTAIPLEFIASRNGNVVVADTTVSFREGASTAVPIGDGQSLMATITRVAPDRLRLTYTAPGIPPQDTLSAAIARYAPSALSPYPPVSFDYVQFADGRSDRPTGNVAVFSVPLPNHEFVEIQIRPGH